jgi:hypothetical protein
MKTYFFGSSARPKPKSTGKVFPTLVKLYEDKGFIWVMDKIKVTEKGVIEGSGPAAERVQKVYDQFISEMTK